MTATIVFLDRETLPPEIVLRPPALPHRWIDHVRTTPDEVVPRCAEADVVVVNKVPLRAETLARLPRLRMIAVAATGTDNVDVEWCREREIVVANVRGYAVHSVPEHTFALILALRRNLIGYRERVRAGGWEEATQFCFFDRPILDLHGARLGIVGAGSIGRAVGDLGRAFGMTVAFAARKGATRVPEDRIAWPELLATSDVITLHCPLTPETRGLIRMPEFEAMARRPLLINTARGGIVDEADLVRAVERGLVSGVGFDVLTREPPVDGNPLAPLLHRPDVILTPHVAWASREAMQTVADTVVDSIEAFLARGPA